MIGQDVAADDETQDQEDRRPIRDRDEGADDRERNADQSKDFLQVHRLPLLLRVVIEGDVALRDVGDRAYAMSRAK
jgi:hypothetical protein